MNDPAFLFYSSDFLVGTMFMTDEQVGQYIKLMCTQHQKGHLSEKDMLKICSTHDEEVLSKFVKDSNGLYYNKRLEDEIIKRKTYSESRRKNRLSTKKDNIHMNNICQSYDEHMENENVNENEDINIDIKCSEEEKKKVQDIKNKMSKFIGG